MMTLGILCSGSLGFDTLKGIHISYKINFVLTDMKSIDIIKFCDIHKINCFSGNPRKNRGYEFVKNIEIDVLVSVNYLFLIEEDLINHPKLLAFNVHGSLLPKYRGRTPHVWSIINNEKETGITAHQIDVGCDTGGIIKQLKIPIQYNETGADILKKFSEKYLYLVEKVLKSVENNQLKISAQNEEEATYYGKRVPEDGGINWEWSKERIYNWVRAQAFPYPGAYTYLDGQKITIDRVRYSNVGFHYKQENGVILKSNPVTVKVSNGALELEVIREQNIKFEVGVLLK